MPEAVILAVLLVLVTSLVSRREGRSNPSLACANSINVTIPNRSWDGDLGTLERDIATVRDDLGADFTSFS